MYKELGGILDMKKDELSKVYSDDFIKYLKIILIDINGMNLRNKLSHSLLNLEEFNHANSFLMIILLLLLVTQKLE